MQVLDYSSTESADDMKLRDDDKKWLSTEVGNQVSTAIAQEINKFNPQGVRKIARFIREWSLAGTLVMAPIALLALAGSGWYYATSRVEKQAIFQKGTEDHFKVVDEHLAEIGRQLVEIRALVVGSQPTSTDNQNAAKKLLAEAKAGSISLPANLVQQVGDSFIGASKTNPLAWNTALQFVNYRSSLNVYTRVVNTIPVPSGSQAQFDIPKVAGKPGPALAHAGPAVALNDAARYEVIGKNLNQPLSFGLAELFLTGGAVILDDVFVRHAVFTNVEVHYTGKPVKLEDVLFVNCTFVLDNTQPSRDLGQALLASGNLDFIYPHSASTS